MAKHRWYGAITLSVILTVCSGCSAIEPSPSPSEPSPIGKVFESETEALAAGEAAYAAFQRSSDEILADGGKNPERLLQFATKGVYERELTGFKQIAADGYHGVGQSTYDSVTLQSANLEGGPGAVVVYLCEDLGATDIRDQNNASVVANDGVERWPLQLSFDYDDHKLIVSDVQDWAGENFC